MKSIFFAGLFTSLLFATNAIAEKIECTQFDKVNATIPEEKDPLELNMEEALILIEKRKEYDKNKKVKKVKSKKGKK